ncbi:MAG: toprim domain-containing protein [Alphaproteobacteria bacterium]
MTLPAPIADVAAGLRGRAEAAAVALLGKPSSRTRHELRFGRHGSLSVEIAGPKTGAWFDHSAGEGGDILALAQREMGREGGLTWARQWLGMEGDRPPPPRQRTEAPKPEPDGADIARKLARARALVERSRPVRGSIAERYLTSRGLVLPDDAGLFDPCSLRFAPDVWHWPSQFRLPAMVAPIVGVTTNELQGLHLTFLAPDGSGKADVGKPRLYFGPKAGGCVKLTDDADVTFGLAVGEGIETSLTAVCSGYSAWACLDAGNLAAFPVLPGIESLLILSDRDDAGLRAAHTAATRWRAAGREVRQWVAPPSAARGADLNDRLREARHG